MRLHPVTFKKQQTWQQYCVIATMFVFVICLHYTYLIPLIHSL